MDGGKGGAIGGEGSRRKGLRGRGIGTDVGSSFHGTVELMSDRLRCSAHHPGGGEGIKKAAVTSPQSRGGDRKELIGGGGGGHWRVVWRRVGVVRVTQFAPALCLFFQAAFVPPVFVQSKRRTTSVLWGGKGGLVRGGGQGSNKWLALGGGSASCGGCLLFVSRFEI